jgi:hypothetical protein
VTAAELRQDVRDGRRFRARDSRSGDDCTYEVLAEVVWGAIPAAQDGSGLGALGGLSWGLGAILGLADVTVRRLLDRGDETDSLGSVDAEPTAATQRQAAARERARAPRSFRSSGTLTHAWPRDAQVEVAALGGFGR